jgi:hypothetical protein
MTKHITVAKSKIKYSKGAHRKTQKSRPCHHKGPSNEMFNAYCEEFICKRNRDRPLFSL